MKIIYGLQLADETLIYKHLDLLFMCMSVCVYDIYVPHVCLLGQNGSLSTLELELQMIINHHVATVKRIQVICMNVLWL